MLYRRSEEFGINTPPGAEEAENFFSELKINSKLSPRFRVV
jgi:hypothetical protein